MPDLSSDDFAWASPPLRDQLRADPAAVLADRGVHAPTDMPPAVLQEFARIALLLWVDGRVVPVDRFHIDPSDEGLLFGRGAWESTRTVNALPWLWDLHTDRLQQTAKLLAIDLDPARVPTAERVRAHVDSITTQDVVIRLNVTAGRPGHPGVVWMSTAPLPVTPPALRLRTCRNPVAKGQAYLTLKTFQYATRLRLGQQAAEAGFDTALVLDANDNVMEASHANVFLRFADGWVTPKADGGLLPGTVRKHLLDRAPVRIIEDVVPAARLAEAQEVFVTNSNAGIIPVTAIDDRTYPVGPETAKLVEWIEPPTRVGQYRFRERGVVRR